MDEPVNNASFEDTTDFDCGRLFRRICGHKILLAGCVVLFLLAGLVYLAVVPKLFQATTIIGVYEPGEDPVGQRRGDVGEMRLKTVEQSLRRISIFRRVVAWDDLRGELFAGDTDEDPVHKVAERLARRTRIRWQRGTSLIFVTVADENPELAVRLADAVVKEFMSDQVEKGREGIESRYGQLSEASEGLGERMREYQKIGAAIHKLGIDGVMEIRRKIELQEQEVSDLAKRKGEKAPGLAQSQKRLDTYRELLERKVSQFEGLVKKGGKFWEGLDLKKLSNLAEEERFDAMTRYVEDREGHLEMKIDTGRELSANLLEEMTELDFLRQIEEPGIRVVEPAFVLPETAGPGRGLVLMVSMFLGLVVGLLLIWCKSVCLAN